MTETRPVKVSAASARQRFNGCEPDYIVNVCKARCCESSVAPRGVSIAIHESERAKIAARGVVIVEGMLQPRPGERRCPFKAESNLCGLHGTPDKPFGCIASPFTLNASGTLIVRNRYRLLKCYDDGRRLPAYRAFAASLVLLFGKEQAERLTAHLDAGGGDLVLPMRRLHYEILQGNTAARKDATKLPLPDGRAPG